METDPHSPKGHWYCPIVEGQICEVCCYYDMDAHDWPRGKWPNICKEMKCEHYNKEETIAHLKLQESEEEHGRK